MGKNQAQVRTALDFREADKKNGWIVRINEVTGLSETEIRGMISNRSFSDRGIRDITMVPKDCSLRPVFTLQAVSE